MTLEATDSFEGLDISLERDVFLRMSLRHLMGILEDMIGLDNASGFLSVVGQKIGEELNAQYKQELHVSRLSRKQISRVMVDLKQRIEGDFCIASESNERIVLRGHACPFGAYVEDRPSMCVMTSNVFGVIAAENQGYAKVVLRKTIARGDAGCDIVVHLKQTPEAENEDGRVYFGT